MEENEMPKLTAFRDVSEANFYFQLANQAQALPGKNLMSLCHPSGHFKLHRVFSPVTYLGFGVWGTPGSSWWGHACVKNLP